jgi:AcrR family transcriptional regulator
VDGQACFAFKLYRLVGIVMARPSQRERILDAAEQVVTARGAARLTLDAVAAEAGVGKGGLIYHFPSKQALLKGLIGRLAANYEASVAAASADPDGSRHPLGAHLRALIDAHERNHRLATALIAVAANEPALLTEVSSRQREIVTRLLNATPRGARAVALTFAIDGLFLLEHLGLRPLKPADRKRVLQAIQDMAADLEESP